MLGFIIFIYYTWIMIRTFQPMHHCFLFLLAFQGCLQADYDDYDSVKVGHCVE